MNINEVFKRYDIKSQAQWKDYHGMQFLIAPIGNPAQKKEVLNSFTLEEAMALEAQGPVAFKDLKATQAIGKIYDLYSKVLVVDWKDVHDGDKPLKFSQAKVFEWMMEFDEFANWVIEQATNVANKLEKKKEETVKN